MPRPGSYSKNKLNNDLLKFYRNLKLKSHFGNQPIDKNTFRPNKKSDWIPPKIPPVIETFITAVNNDVNEASTKEIPNDNLSIQEQKAMKDLQDRSDIIIKKADKGGAVVIWNTEDYIKEADRQLNDTTSYKKLDTNPTEDNVKKIKSTIDQLKKQELISEKVSDSLIPENVKTPRFYMFPKIHKPNNPGRPVISSVSSHTSEISIFVDHHLQDNVKELKSYVKDTTNFIKKVESQPPIPDNCFLVSMDVRSLYTNIPHKEGIEAVKESLEKKPPSAPIIVILTFLNLILTLNNFIFNGINYLQVKGCAMGTKCAPCYANIFMGKFEETYIYPRIKKHCILYLRYIDDIFMIWKGTKAEFKEFIDEINQCHLTIKFDYEIDENSINFLDTTVYKDSNYKLRTTLYKKPTDRQNYLHLKSEHPPSLKNSIPYSQALRIRKICHDDQHALENCNKLANTFEKRGYKTEQVSKQIRKALQTPRENLLKDKEKEQSNRIPLILKYNRTLPSIKNIINKHWDILQIDRDIKDTFTEKPVIAYRRNKNLRDFIGSNTIENNTKTTKTTSTNNLNVGKCQPCFGRDGNLCCQQIKTTSNFKSDSTGKIFNIFHNVNCKSKNLIYLMECDLCQKKAICGEM